MKKKTNIEPVFEAVLTGNLQLLKQAITSSKNVNVVDCDGRTALFHAAIDGRPDFVLELVELGLEVNAKDNAGKTALHLAVIQGQLECAKTLLRCGAFVDAQDNEGNSPLSDAAFYSNGRGELIGLLLEHQANPLLKNRHGISPRELADSIGNYDIAKFFK